MDEIPEGYCQCGCGQLAPIAKVNDKHQGRIKGQPLHFIHNHHLRKQITKHPRQTRRKHIEQEMIQCACGCGKWIERYYFSGKLWHERKYVHNHHAIGRPASEKLKRVLATRNKQLMNDPVEKARRIEKRRENPRWIASVSREAAYRRWDKRGRSPTRKYPKEWTRELRETIKQRDGYKCHHCNGTNRLSVHHIDLDKGNCNPSNLITLCNSCHMKLHGRIATN